MSVAIGLIYLITQIVWGVSHEYVAAFHSGVDRHVLAGFRRMRQRCACGWLPEDRHRIPGSGARVRPHAAHDGVHDRIDLGMPYQSRSHDRLFGRVAITPEGRRAL